MFELFLVGAILAVCFPAHTQVTEPESVAIYHADFQGAEDTNYDAWPDEWTRRRGKGYPPYIAVEIAADDSAEETSRCLRFSMDGGGAQVYAPSMPVRPQFSYLLEARIRTEKLRYNDVLFSVLFFDADDNLVATHESQPIQQADQWQTVRLGPLSCTEPKVQRAILSIHVRPGSLADLDGRVYVDDVRFSRLPRMSVETNNEFGIYLDPHHVQVTCRVSGFSKPNPPITFELIDIEGRQIDVVELNVSSDEPVSRGRSRTYSTVHKPELGFAGSVTWKPPIPDFGYYVVKVSTPEHCGLKQSVVVAPPMERLKKSEFGWSFPDGEGTVNLKTLPNLLSQAGVHWVKFPVWFTAKDPRRGEAIAAFAERLDVADMKLVGVLDQPPSEVRELFGVSGRMASASIFEDKAVWQPAVDHVMTRLSLKVEWWQLGRDSDTSFSSYADLNAKIADIKNDLATFGKKVQIGIPWRIIEETPTDEQPSWSFLSFVDSSPLTDAEIRSYLESPSEKKGDRWVVLQPLDARHYDIATRAGDLVRQMVGAKIAKADGIFIPNPSDPHQGLLNGDNSPGELLLPWRTTAMLIGGYEYLGAMKTAGGSDAHVFASGNRGLMVLWNAESKTESLFLGEQIRLHDIWGRSFVPPQHREGEFTRHEISVGPTPIFISGVNPAIAKWCMRFQLDTDCLANEFGREQVIQYRFQNPFPTSVAGRLTFQTPDVWRSERTSRQFRLASGEELQDELRVILGPDANTGPQPIRIDFELSLEDGLRFSVNESIDIGLGDIVVEVDSHIDDHGNLIVEQHLINNTDKPVNFNCMLFAPNRRRDKRAMFNIERGRTTNVFVLPDADELLGKTLWIRAEEIGGSRILNDRLVAHE